MTLFQKKIVAAIRSSVCNCRRIKFVTLIGVLLVFLGLFALQLSVVSSYMKAFLPTTQSQQQQEPQSNNYNKLLDAHDVVKALEQLSVEEEDAIFAKLHGREFPYPLACPRGTIQGHENATVVVGYHVGMLKNWRSVLKDQLYTLHHCGLGNKLVHLYLTYSNHDANNTVEELKSILARYPFANRTTMRESLGQPVEGTAINMIHKACQQLPAPEKSVAFYFHTKATSRYNPNWEKNPGAGFGYGTSLHWRKYMEYFTIERPEICMDKILNEGKYACGVWWQTRRLFYGGNFWSASCDYLQKNKALEITPMTDVNRRWNAERWITEGITEGIRAEGKFSDWGKFYTSSQPPHGLYKYLHRPEGYDDYSRRWKSPA